MLEMTEIQKFSDKNSEQKLLALMIKGDCKDLALSLHDRDFESSENRTIFSVIRSLALSGMPVNRDILAQELQTQSKLGQIGGSLYLFFLDGLNVFYDDSKYYLEKVKAASKKRQLFNLVQEMIKNVQKDFNPDQLILECQKQLFEINLDCNKRFYSFSEIGDQLYGQKGGIKNILLTKAQKFAGGISEFHGFKTGYDLLDSMILGFRNGSNIYIGARPGSGKTTLTCNFMLNLCKNYPDLKIGFFSLEQSKEAIFDKLLCSMAETNPIKVAQGDLTVQQIDLLHQHYENIKKFPIYLYDYPGPKLDQIKAQVHAAYNHGIRIFFTDYLSLIKPNTKFDNHHLQIDEISKMLQSLAREYNCPFITLCQLNRAMVDRQYKEPVMTDLRASGSLEEDADLIMLLWRPSYHDQYQNQNITELRVCKNRIFSSLGKVSFEHRDGIYYELPELQSLLPADVYHEKEDKKWR